MTEEEQKILRDIRSRHIALCRMFGTQHDCLPGIKQICFNACDCIRTVMDNYGYKLALDGEDVTEKMHRVYVSQNGDSYLLPKACWVKK